jgi:hypothetical protein
MGKGSIMNMAASKILVLLISIPGAIAFSSTPLTPSCMKRGLHPRILAAGCSSHPMHVNSLVLARRFVAGIRGTCTARTGGIYMQSSSSPSDGMSWIDVDISDAEDEQGSRPSPSPHSTRELIDSAPSLFIFSFSADNLRTDLSPIKWKFLEILTHNRGWKCGTLLK